MHIQINVLNMIMITNYIMYNINYILLIILLIYYILIINENYSSKIFPT